MVVPDAEEAPSEADRGGFDLFGRRKSFFSMALARMVLLRIVALREPYLSCCPNHGGSRTRFVRFGEIRFRAVRFVWIGFVKPTVKFDLSAAT
jgi:hypothetical protein